MKRHNLLQKYAALSLTGFSAITHAAAQQPNIVVIMADDMGYSDLGCYGGEISTPNIDRLAENGIRYTHFYNGARSCPTRASLLTGLYAHQAGMGWMTIAYEGEGSYQGDLSKNAVTLAEYLRSGGYNTYMAGKWHVSNYRKTNRNIKDNWPLQRGFDKYFGILGGADNYFTPTLCIQNDKVDAPADFYLTDAISDNAVTYIEQNRDHPFFLYVAYTAPHWPLHARPEDIAKYDGKYDIGWDQVRENRFTKQKELHLIDENFILPPRDSDVKAWDELSTADKKLFAQRMQIYAAQVEVMDRGIGKIIAQLEENGLLDNTLIMFLSDNGASAEEQSSGESKEATGAENTYESYRIGWVNVSNTPYREYKHYAHEGGIITPFIVHWPQGVTRPKGSYVKTPGHLIDIFKTIEEITEIPYPDAYDGNTIIPLQGESMLPLFYGEERARGPMFWEHESNIAVRMDNWKLVAKTPTGTNPVGPLELYDITEDPMETNDLAKSDPEKTQELWNMWYHWAEENDIFPLSTLSYGQRQNDDRYLNGEFNGALYGWNLTTSGTGTGSLALDRTNQISGQYSGKINITRTGERPNNILMTWVLPLKKNERCKIRFKAKANKDITMIVRLEKNSDGFDKIIDQTIEVSKDIRTFEFDSDIVPADFNYRIGFYFGSTVPSNVWIDAVELIFINNDLNLSPTWDFKALEGAEYSVEFTGRTSQFLVPVTFNLKRKDNPQEIYYTETVKLKQTEQKFRLDIPDAIKDEKLYVELQIPPYATQDTYITDLKLNVDGNTSIQENESLTSYEIYRNGNSFYLSPKDQEKTYSLELFDLNGKLIESHAGLKGDFIIKEKSSGNYILRLREAEKIVFVQKLIF